MRTPTSATWTVRGATFALWALAAASAVFWGLRLGGPRPALDGPLPPARPVATVDPAAIARLLGSSPAAAAAPATPAAPTLASRLQLVGVAAGVQSGAGAAILSVDGKPARHYRVGSVIEEGLVLQSVHGRQAVLGASRNGPPLLTLEVPLPQPSTRPLTPLQAGPQIFAPQVPAPQQPAPQQPAPQQFTPQQLPPGSPVPQQAPAQPPAQQLGAPSRAMPQGRQARPPPVPQMPQPR